MKVGIIGAGGQMGQELVKILGKDNELFLFDKEESSCSFFGKTFNIVNDLDSVIKQSNKVIDFSSKAITIMAAKKCFEHKVPMVIGTTGLDAQDFEVLQELAKEIPIFYSANMSIGIAILVELGKIATFLTKDLDYDIELFEAHHRRKKDAPSGTALKIIGEINQVLEIGDAGYNTYNAQSKKGREKGKVGVSSMRGGGIVGTHNLRFISEEDILTVGHEAFSRGIFARGAVEASKFIVLQKNGLYGMQDLLNFNQKLKSYFK